MKKERSIPGVAVLFCAPLSKYPTQPEDISKADPVPCPTCAGMMWLSEKKKMWKEISEKLGKEILMECYDCFMDRVKENPEMLRDHYRVDI